MNRASSCSLIRKLSAVVAALIIATTLLPGWVSAQESREPLTKDEIIDLVKSGVPSRRVESLAREYGISFGVTKETERELGAAGASIDLLITLRELAPKPSVPVPVPIPAAPPTLLIEATPGGVQAYIDDEPVGTTSSAGRLRLRQLTPGKHRVRLSHAGYRDYEQSVELKAGQTVKLTARLKVASGRVASKTTTAAPGAAKKAVPPRDTGMQDPAASFKLGLRYAKGDGVPKNNALAVKWYRKAAEQGHRIAQSNLGLMYANGKGVPKNDALAVKWYRKAAEQGYARAQFNLGNKYRAGEGVRKNMTLAVRWYRKAAAQGYAGAQNNLGFSYEQGEGAPKDYVQAYIWYSLGAAGGNKIAPSNLKKLSKKMSLRQIAEARRRAREWTKEP